MTQLPLLPADEKPPVDVDRVVASIQDIAHRAEIAISASPTTEELVALLEKAGRMLSGGRDLRRRIAWLAETEQGEAYVAVGRLEYALFRSEQVP